VRIVRPYARLMDSTRLLEALARIEWCARISHRSEDAADSSDSDKTKRFIKSVVIEHGDWSVVEHVSASVDMLVDRGITHELVRHRLASYTQESTRFVNYEKKMLPSFIYPKPDIECSRCLAGDESKRLSVHDDHWMHETSGCVESCPYDETWLSGVAHCERVYIGLLKKGWRPQEARSVFPNALASRIVVTTNLRNWRHLFIMRTTKEAHPQMRQVMIPLLTEFTAHVPLLFADIQPDSRQVDNLRLPR